ncbi:MAG: arginine--tRNA ligase [Candidatus Omnitrophota bacterium]|nr:MAG: arginine--tRNA ligase [Candidatus Omnitrophota bacterium]
MKGFYQKASSVLEEILKKDFHKELEPPLWELPPKQEFGDFSSMVALKLASKLKKDPLEIAVQLKSSLEKLLSPDVEKVDILRPGFINVFVSRKALIQSLNELLKSRDRFFRQQLKKRVLLEFVSANPTGPLSIAHGRQALVGDVIGRILEFFGNTVEREYYVNDEGRQIELLVESVQARIKEVRGEEFHFPEDGYRAAYVKDIAQKFFQEKRKNVKRFTLSHTLSLIKRDLRRLNIQFDNWVSQGKLIQDGKVKDAIALLKKKGHIYEKEGACWFSSTHFGDDKDRVIQKGAGSFTYFASDIAYHREKIKREFDELINLWGPDHHGYIERVIASIEAFGFSREILKIIIIQLVSIKTKERMSRRKGTAVLLSDLIDEVGKDAVRFYYLTRRNSSHLEFDIDLAQEASFNNPLYYVQYACARIESIFRKAKKKSLPSHSEFLQSEDEINLLRLLLQFSYSLEKAYYSLEPVFIIEYLKSLAAYFHKFYERRRVLGEAQNVMCARLNLLKATKVVLGCGLTLLGIKPLKRM